MVDVCLNCGDIGIDEALTFCHNCKAYAVHLYCLPEIPDDFDGVVWLCEDCEPEVQTLSSPDKCSHECQSLGSVYDKENNSLIESLNTSEDLVLAKSSHLQLDSENFDSDNENQRHCESADICSMDETVENIEINNAQLDPVQYRELEMNGYDERDKHEKHRELVAVTESGKQHIDLSQFDSCENSRDIANQLDSDNFDSGHENQRHCESADICSMEETVENIESKNAQLDLVQCQELEMNGYDERDKHEKHRELVAVTEVGKQRIDVSEFDSCENSREQQLVTFHSSDPIAQPIEQPSWWGQLNIADKYNRIDGRLELTAHLSSLACTRVSNEAKCFPVVLSSELLPRSTLWPKSFAKSGPSYDSIALYFFPDSERSERVYHSLVNEMIDRDLGIRAEVQNADLLIFTSRLMPMDYWRFQSKYYLWGVFKAKSITQVSERQSPYGPLSNDQRCSMASISKSVVVELNHSLKLNSDNYEIWSMKIQYILEDQDVADTIRTVMAKPIEGTTDQHRIDQEVYEAWRKRNSHARRILLSAMDDGIAKQFHKYEIAKDLWDSLKVKFEGVPLTKLQSLIIKFDTYMKRPEHSMKRHLREMSNMISELDDVGYKLTEVQKVQALMRSLPHSWEHMKMHLTHAKSIKTFDDAIRHLELEDYRQVSIKINVEAHYALIGNSFNAYGKNRKCFFGKEKEQKTQTSQSSLTVRKKNEKRNVSKVKCYRCQRKGHYAKDCKFERQIIYSGATEHVTQAKCLKRNVSKVKCYRCQQKGHYAKDCKFEG